VDSGSFDPGINPHSGKFDFVGGSGSTSGSSGTLTQNVVLVGNQGITVAAIDAGTLQAAVSFFEQGLNQGNPSDNAQVSLTFRDGANSVLNTITTPVVDSHNGSWQQFSGSFAIPVGTRSLDYTIHFLRNVGTDLDAFVDDTTLTVQAGAATSPPLIHPDRVGLFHGDGTWTLYLSGNGSNPVTFNFGTAGDQPITGDWDGSAFDAVGTVRVDPVAFAPDGKTHALLVSMDTNGDHQWDAGDQSFIFGAEGDQIVLGDWNGDGKTKIGVVRPDPSGNGGLVWSLDYNGDHTWIVYHFGATGDTAVFGDWNGDGKTKIGVVRADTKVTLADGSHSLQWSLDVAGTGVFSGLVYTFGTSNDGQLAGDWNGDGKTKIGVAQAGTNGGADFLLDLNGDGVAEPATERFAYGLATDILFRGDWSGNGKDMIGIARPAASGSALTFALDTNGDHAYDGGDAAFSLPGGSGDTIFIGKWKP
jgi:hypothetical protein